MSTDRERGILIAVEGIDGAGKTTQVGLLREALESVGEEVVTSKEPTNGIWGQKIRESASSGRLPLDEELEAFIQDRIEHVGEIVRPSLEAGKIVILDRYFYSTIAYQGSRGADTKSIDEKMRAFAPLPDVVYVLDVEPVAAIERIRVRDVTPNEFEKIENLSNVRRVFSELARIDSLICKIDGSGVIGSVHRAMLSHFLQGPLKPKRCAKIYGCDDPFHCGPRITGTCRWYEIVRTLSPSLLARDSPSRAGHPESLRAT